MGQVYESGRSVLGVNSGNAPFTVILFKAFAIVFIILYMNPTGGDITALQDVTIAGNQLKGSLQLSSHSS